MFKILSFFLLVGSLLWSTHLGAQSDLSTIGRNFSQEEGITASEMYCLMEADDLSMFVGTDQGVFRISGNDITHYTSNEGLIDNTVFSFFKDSKGRIWAATYSGGVAYFENEVWSVPAWNDQLKASLKSSFAYYLYVDENDYLFVQPFHEHNGPLFYGHMNDSAMSTLEFEADSVRNTEKATAYLSTDGRVVMSHIKRWTPQQLRIAAEKWGRPKASSHNGFTLQFDTLEASPLSEVNLDILQIEYTVRYSSSEATRPASRAFYTPKLRSSDINIFIGHYALWLHKPDGSTIYTDSLRTHALSVNVIGDTLFVGLYSNGLKMYVFDEEGNITFQKDYFGNSSVNHVFKDSQGNYWVCTVNHGIFKVSDWNTESTPFPVSLTYDAVRGHLNYYNNQLNILANKSLYEFSLPNQSLGNLTPLRETLFTNEPIQYENFTRVFWSDSIAFSKSFYQINLNQRTLALNYWIENPDISGPSIRQINKPGDVSDIDRINDRLYNLVSNNRIIRIEEDEARILPSIPEETLFEELISVDGKVKYASSFNGLFILQNDTLVRAFPQYDISGVRIQFLEKAGEGWYVGSTKDQGVILFNDDTLIHLDVETYLPDGGITDISTRGNEIFVACNQGIFVGWLNAAGLESFKHIPLEQIDLISSIDDVIPLPYGIIVADERHLTFIDNSLIERKEKTSPFTVSLADEYDSERDEHQLLRIRMPRGARSLEIQLKPASILPGENLLWKWQLEGAEKWNYTTDGIIDLQNLSPKKYKVFCQFRNEYGIWTDVVEIAEFRVKPLVTQTWWFWTSILSPLLFLLIVALRNIFHQRALSQALIESNMSTLKMQINPHFIFNSFNSIQYLITTKKNDTASEYLGRLAGLIRKTIERPDLHRISLEEELAYITEFLSIEALRLDYRFDFKIECDPNINKSITYIPPMLLQPILENSVWHGVSKMESGGEVNIRIVSSEDTLYIHMTDNGSGFPQERWETLQKGGHINGSLGLQNVIKRLALLSEMHDKRYELSLEKSVKGTHFVLKLAL